MKIVLAAIGGMFVGIAIGAGGILWAFGLVIVFCAAMMDERDRRPQGRYVDHTRGWK